MTDVLPPPDTNTYVPPAADTSGATSATSSDQTGAASTSAGTGPGLVRPRNGRRIAGVCAGIADRYGWDPTIVRLVAVLSIFLPGPQVLAYLVLWLVMPSDDA